MNHSELVAKTAKDAGVSQATASYLLDAALYVIAEELRVNTEVSLKGIGKLIRVTRPERIGRNPKTGEPVTIPKRQGVKFKRSKMLVL